MGQWVNKEMRAIDILVAVAVKKIHLKSILLLLDKVFEKTKYVFTLYINLKF